MPSARGRGRAHRPSAARQSSSSRYRRQEQADDDDDGEDQQNAPDARILSVHDLAVVFELERYGVALGLVAQPPDNALEVVLALAADADRVALDLRLHLREVIADELRDLLREIVGEAAPKRDLLLDRVASGLLDLGPLEDLE